MALSLAETRRRRTGGLLLLAGCSLCALATSATAQTAASDDIVVTGQAPPGAVIGDIPAQNQLDRADIDAYGVDTISELLFGSETALMPEIAPDKMVATCAGSFA